MSTTDVRPSRPPGIEKPKRLRPKLAYELIACGVRGHELIGTDVARVRAEDGLVLRESEGLRWYRCLRCDSWLPLQPPTSPSQDVLPPREQIELPLRGRPLRDRVVLRLIAIDRILHFLALGALAVGIFLFAYHRDQLRGDWTRVLNRLQAVFGGPFSNTNKGLLHDIDRLFTISPGRLLLYGTGIALYAALNGVEAYGLWRARRWAEYLTLIEVILLVPYEVYELSLTISPLKIFTLVLNLVVVAYLLYAHRLFGVRGGGAAERAERERDTGWPALERVAS